MKHPRVLAWSGVVLTACLMLVVWRNDWRLKGRDTEQKTAPFGHPAASQPAPGSAVPSAALRSESLPNFDRRIDRSSQDAPPASAVRSDRQAAADRLRALVPGVRVDFDQTLGSPAFIASTDRFLASTGDSAGAVPAARLARFAPDDPQRLVKAFIDEHAALFGHDSSALAEAKLVRDYDTTHNGMHTFVWQQELDGVRVFESTLQAHLTKKGDLVNLASRFVPDAAGAAPNRTVAVAAPKIDAKTAVSAAGANVGEKVPAAQIAENAPPVGPSHKQQFRSSRLLDVSAEYVWLPENERSLRLCWEVNFTSKSRGEMFRSLVDAETGDVLMRQGLTEYLSAASYRVFTSDSPTPFSPGLSSPGITQPAEVARTLVTLDALNTTASPNGWIDDAVNETRGNNVDAHTDINADNVADTPRPQGSPSRVFDFTFDSTQAPSTYRKAAVTQLFYWCNLMHDKLYELGFTEAAGNFQVNNFGRGGSGNDPVQADAQDGSGTNNANFSTPADGSSGRMQMFLYTGPTPDRDSSFDAEIVLHEYTHGLSNRLVGGGVGISAMVTRGMGEGWSDFYSMTMLAEQGDDVNGNWAHGAYARYGYIGIFFQNYYYGIRRYPYTTDLSKNPLTFKDIDPAQATPHLGIPISPVVGGGADEAHNMGQVWAAALWDARANLITKLGYSAGNAVALRLATDAMKLGPANPNFLQARNAILQADLVNNSGANQNELWAAFARRGMGTSASAPASSTTDGLVESYDLPDDLAVSPASVFAASGGVGGPFGPSLKTYTLTNNGTASVSWTASKTQPWLTISPTSGTLGPKATRAVNVSINSGANACTGGVFADAVNFHNNTSGANRARSVSLSVTPPRVASFALDSDPGWSRAGQWAFGKPTGGGSSLDSEPDPVAGATGTNVFGVNLSGSYSTTVSGPYYLTTTAMNLTGYTGTRLQFQRWLNTGYQPYAYATIDVSTDGTTWTHIWTNHISGAITDLAWTKVQYDLSAVADNQATVYVRWGYQITSGGSAYSGWNIDDIEILGAQPSHLTISAPAAMKEGDAAATGTITTSPAPPTALVVNLTSSDPARLTVPASVTLAAGATTATFAVTAINDTLLNGSKIVTLAPAAGNWIAHPTTVVVNDNETTVLAVSLPASATEGAGSVTGTVTSSAAPAVDVAVQLTSSNPGEIAVPATVTLPAGQKSATFSAQIVDDARIDGASVSTVTANVANWTDGVATVTVQDNENLNLALALPTSVREGDTARSGTASLSGTWPLDVVVALSSNNPTELSVPGNVIIPAGQTSVSFPLTIGNDTLTDGPLTVSVSASASGFIQAAASVAVQDDDVHHFSIASIANPQRRGVAFPVSITAKDVNEATLPNYHGLLALSATGNSGPAEVSPISMGAFVNGVWTGNATVGSLGTQVVLTVDDGEGHTGASNPFDVGTGSVDHFAWSTITSPQTRDTPLTATLTAQDAANNTVASFTGMANLRALTSTLNTAIGTGSGASSMPFYDSFAKVRSQTIYLASEMGGAARLTGLALYVDTPSAGQFSNWTIRLKHTSQASYAGGSWDGNGWTVVHQSNATPSATGWRTFNFSMPFDYNGTSNLLVDFSFNNTNANNFTATCRSTSTTTNRTTYGYGIASDPLTWSGTSGAAPSVSPLVTNVQFFAERAIPIRPEEAGAFVQGMWTGEMSVPFAAAEVKLSADDGAGGIGTSNTFQVNAPAAGGGGGAITIILPAQASEGAGALTGTVTLPTAAASDTVVNLTSSAPAKAAVPGSVTVPAGQQSANFVFTVLDDALLDGNKSISIGALVEDGSSGSAAMTVLDNEVGTLVLNVPASTSESAGTVQGTLTISPVPAGTVSVALASSDPSAVTVPASVTFALGQASAVVPFTILNDTKITGTHSATITASVAGWASASNTLSILDDESTNLVLNVSTAIEGSTSAATVFIGGTRSSALVVSLSSANTARLTVPASVTIPAGSISAFFTVTGVDNSLTDGTALADVTASASGFTSATNSVTVYDNDVHHYSVSAIGASQIANAPINVTFAALTIDNRNISNLTTFGGLRARLNGLTLPMTPSSVTISNGSASASVSINGTGNGVTLTIADPLGKTGTSNSFNLGIGPPDHFSLSTIASPQTTGTTFPVTITAQDTYNNTVPTYAGTATLSAGPAPKVTGFGSATGAYILDINPQQRDQIIYLPSEVGPAGKITSLAFQIYTGTTGTLPNFTVRLKHTSLSSYSGLPQWESTDWTTVYQGTPALAITGTAWLTVQLSTPFDYDGISNLMVDVTHDGTGLDGGAYYSSGFDRRMIAYRGSGLPDPLTWSGTSDPTPAAASLVPNMRVQRERTFPLTRSVTGNFTAGVWTGDVAINQAVPGTMLFADSGSGVTGESNMFVVHGSPALEVTPSSGVSALATFGAAPTPSSISFTVSNTGTDSMEWSAGTPVAWLALSATGGVLAAGASTPLTATLNLAGVSPGDYSGIITFTNVSTGIGNTTRHVALSVTLPAPTISAEPSITGGSSNTVAWSPMTGATAYEVQAADNAAFNDALSSDWIGGTSFTFSPLTDGAAWHYRVRSRAVPAGTTSAWSSEVVSTQDATAPAVVPTSPSNAAVIDYALTGTANDFSNIASLAVNGMPASTTDGYAHWSAAATLEAGANTFTIVAQDNAVPPNTTTILFTINRLPLDLNANGLPDEWEAKYQLSASDLAFGDRDRDGLLNIVEYALDLNPTSSGGPSGYWTTNEVNPADGKHYLVLHYRRRLGPTGWSIDVETSADASQWSSAPGTCEEAQAPTLQPGGECEIAHMRVLQPIGSGGSAKAFVRLNIHSL